MTAYETIVKFIPAVIAWVLLLTSTALFFIYPCQFLQIKYHVSIVIFQAVITLFVISNFFLATFMDPGIIPKAYPEEDDDDFRAPLFKSVEVNGIQVRMKWCITCKFYRPPRCSHCSECNTCIETFDHHCPWVNNCIGRRNYRHFFFFLVFLSIHMVTVFIWCLLYVLNHKERLYETESVVALILMTLIVLLTIPILGLTSFHIFLVSRGRTTNEQITGKFQNGYNPFTKGCVLNWCYILCGPKFPKHKLIRKSNEFFLNLEVNTLNDVTTNDKIVRVYLDNDDKSLIQKSSLNKTTFLFNKNNNENKANISYNENGSTINDLVESISRDCEPSPPSTLKSQNPDWKKRSQQQQNNNNSQSKLLNNFNQFNSYANSKLSYHYNTSPNNNLTSSQSQVLYSQHFPLRNNKLENSSTVNQQQQKLQNNYEPANEIGLHLISQPGSHLSNFYHQFNTRSTSPTKSTSISEISPYAHYHSKQPIKSNNTHPNSGVVVYYSPQSEESSNQLMITDLDNVGNKFASETELQKLKEHLIYPSSDNHQQLNTSSSSNKSKYFFSNKRPLSFKKALEITENLERTNLPNNSTHTNNNTIKTGTKINSSNEGTNLTIDNKEDNRHSQYDMNYEISV